MAMVNENIVVRLAQASDITAGETTAGALSRKKSCR